MPTFLTLLVRVVLLVAGAIFAASVAVAAVIGLALWGIRAGWNKLTGRPVAPFIVRFRSPGFAVRPSPQQQSRTPRADAVAHGKHVGDVTDVELK
jgi:hypothetical protein